MSSYHQHYPGKRFLEIIPGSLSWIIIALPVILSLTKPGWVAIFMILFDFYWLIKALYMGAHLISSYRYMKRERKINWLNRLKELEDFDHHYRIVKESYQGAQGWAKKRFAEELAELNILKEGKELIKDWRDIYHIVILPTYQESIEVLDASIEAVKKSRYPNKKIIVVLAIEERVGQPAEERATKLKAKYRDAFFKFLITKHPDGIVGEMKAKGANVTWAAKQVRKFIDQQGIEYHNVVVSTFDCDTRPSSQYFSALTYKYIINPNRLRRSFQPIPIYSNNIWQVPLINRLVAHGSTFWQMIESTRPWRMINFSSQAMSLQTLIAINYWDVGIISEDSKQYYRAYFTFQGDHRCVPIFTPVYMDAMEGQSLWEALKNQYQQKKRWAWGVEHFPYLIRELIKHKEIPLGSRLVQLGRVVEAHISWATAALLIALAGWIPLLVNPAFRTTVLAYNLPYLARVLLTISWVGLFVSGAISILILPQPPEGYTIKDYLGTLAMWALVPISAIFFGSIPALDAQTRLMLGKYMGFWVTPKGQEAKKR
jgi:hypothetical protein